MSEDKYLKEVSRKPIFRVAAWIALILIVALIISTFVAGITGSKYFMGFLVLSMIIPVFVYIVLFVGRIMYNSANKQNGHDDIDK